MEEFTFYDLYYDAISGVTPANLPDNLQGAFNIFKKTFDIKTARSESGKKGGQKKKPLMTLAKIREDFPEITGNLSENNEILEGVNLGSLYKFIKKNEEVRRLSMYNIVTKFKEKQE